MVTKEWLYESNLADNLPRTPSELAHVYQTDVPAKGLNYRTVLMVGWDMRKKMKDVDVFPSMRLASYHTVVINGRKLDKSLSALWTLWPLAERIVHIDGAKLSKTRLTKKLCVGMGEEDIDIVHWHGGITDDPEEPEISTLIFRSGWHGRCLNCGECCGNIAKFKDQDIFDALASPCQYCHSGVKTVRCPQLIISNEGTYCAIYEDRLNCCRSYPARNPMCTFIQPTCGLFHKGYIENRAEWTRIARENKQKRIEDHKSGRVTTKKYKRYTNKG